MKQLILVLFVFSSSHSAHGSCHLLQGANDAWITGRVRRADQIARNVSNIPKCRNEAFSLLTKTRFAAGRYRSALSKFSRIQLKYPGRSELLPVVTNAFELLNRLADARAFMRNEGMKNEWLEKSLDHRIANPMIVESDGSPEIPISSDSLSKYLPGFQGSISGPTGSWSGIVRVDTGSSFLAMAPTLGDQLGLKKVVCAKGQQGENKAEICFGVLNFGVGGINITNLPTITISTLPENIGPIVGTRFLRLFNSTLDYPNGEIHLLPRSEDSFSNESTKSCRSLPFFMWGDHYMFARGGLDSKRDLTYFIDSGSVFVDTTGIQSAISVRRSLLVDLGYSMQSDPRGFVSAKEKTFLGKIGVTDQLIHFREKLPVQSLGGVEIHGSLSHGFLKNFKWSIDFNRMKYWLCR